MVKKRQASALAATAHGGSQKLGKSPFFRPSEIYANYSLQTAVVKTFTTEKDPTGFRPITGNYG
jgi:hypothetical protein